LIGPHGLAAQGPTKLTGIRFSYPTYVSGGDILYESMAAGSWDVYRIPGSGMDDAGSTILRITDSPALERMPAMSPDGRYIAFISDRGGNFDVWRMNADGSDPVQLTRTDVAEIHPFWTPDARRIVFNRRVAGARVYAIWSMAADGSDPQVLLQDSDLNSYAQVSPDGRFMVFDKWWDNDGTNGEIMVMELATRKLRRMTENHVYDGYPAWFPDSRHIVYSSEVGGVFKLFRMDVTTGVRTQLTFGPGNDQRADVSPDGTRVLFNRDMDNSIEIFELTLEQDGAPRRTGSRR
jgi:TolB protein